MKGERFIPGTVKQSARLLELGPGSSFRELKLDNKNEAAAGLLMSIGGLRKGGAVKCAGSTFSVIEMNQQLQKHLAQQSLRRQSVAVLNQSKHMEEIRRHTLQAKKREL